MHQVREAVGCDAGDVPEKVEVGDAFESGQTGETGIGEGTIDEETGTFFAVPLFQQWEIVQ